MFQKSQSIFFYYEIHPSNLREIKRELPQLTNVEVEDSEQYYGLWPKSVAGKKPLGLLPVTG